jgi:hypothetical protein
MWASGIACTSARNAGSYPQLRSPEQLCPGAAGVDDVAVRGDAEAPGEQAPLWEAPAPGPLERRYAALPRMRIPV